MSSIFTSPPPEVFQLRKTKYIYDMTFMSDCIIFSNTVYNMVKNRPEINGRILLPLKDDKNFCFLLEFILPEEKGRFGLSVSIPFDARGNRGIKYGEGYPSIIETALIKIPKNGNLSDMSTGLVYNYSCGYYDVRRPIGIDGLVEEIVLVADLLASPDFRENEPEQYDDDDEQSESDDSDHQYESDDSVDSNVPVKKHPLREDVCKRGSP